MLPFRTLLVPTDFSDGARRAIDVAVDLAVRYDAELVLLHAWQPGVVGDAFAVMPTPLGELEAAAEAGVAAAADELRGRGARVRTRVVMGDAGAEIIEAATAEHADLIVMGTHGRSGLARVLLGSAADHVIRHAPCPVLTVRGGT